MDIAVQIAMLAAAAGIVILVILAIPILIDLRRIVGSWKKISNFLELTFIPITWGASFIAELFNKLVDIGEKGKKGRDSGHTQK